MEVLFFFKFISKCIFGQILEPIVTPAVRILIGSLPLFPSDQSDRPLISHGRARAGRPFSGSRLRGVQQEVGEGGGVTERLMRGEKCSGRRWRVAARSGVSTCTPWSLQSSAGMNLRPAGSGRVSWLGRSWKQQRREGWTRSPGRPWEPLAPVADDVLALLVSHAAAFRPSASPPTL